MTELTQMEHDPLCPWAARALPNQCYHIVGLHEHPMTLCQLIALVRGDERQRITQAV
jgi:hypothetical protein